MFPCCTFYNFENLFSIESLFGIYLLIHCCASSPHAYLSLKKSILGFSIIKRKLDLPISLWIDSWFQTFEPTDLSLWLCHYFPGPTGSNRILWFLNHWSGSYWKVAGCCWMRTNQSPHWFYFDRVLCYVAT